jgi:CrcB protein
VRVLLIGAGGFVGSILRYWMSGVVQASAPRTAFPVGTLAVNIAGCLAIGLLAELAEARGFLSPDERALLMVGFLGAFTTFSAFANETLSALRGGAFVLGVLNIVASVGGCLFAVWAGRALVQLIWR